MQYKKNNKFEYTGLGRQKIDKAVALPPNPQMLVPRLPLLVLALPKRGSFFSKCGK
jgi:hypothetical protein